MNLSLALANHKRHDRGKCNAWCLQASTTSAVADGRRVVAGATRLARELRGIDRLAQQVRGVRQQLEGLERVLDPHLARQGF